MLLRAVRSLYFHYEVFSSMTDIMRYRRARESIGPGNPVSVRVRKAGGHPLWVRPGTTDWRVLWDTFHHQYHLPPIPLGSTPVIVDLGANVGYTAAHFAYLYPKAQILAVEMDEENIRAAALNTRFLRQRRRLIHAAVWSREGRVLYGGDGEWGWHILKEDPGPVKTKAAPAKTLDRIFMENGLDHVDYLKMDIEGAEAEVLQGSLNWAKNVRSMKIEVHPDFNKDATIVHCSGLLESHGFQCRPDERYPKCLIALKPPSHVR